MTLLGGTAAAWPLDLRDVLDNFQNVGIKTRRHLLARLLPR
jgi:hypothetical protein